MKLKSNILNPDMRDTRLLRDQLNDHFSNDRAALIGNAVNALVALLVCAAVAPIALLIGLATAMFSLLAYRISVSRQFQAAISDDDLPKIARKIDYVAAALSCFWTVTILSLFSWADPGRQMVMGLLSAGMMSAGVATFRTRRYAAMIYLVGMIPGPLVAFSSLDDPVRAAAIALLLSYSSFLFKQIINVSNRFDAATKRAKELQASSETIAVLLDDYAEHGSDWLFETSAQGAIINPSLRFGEMSGRPAESLDGRDFVSLFDEDNGRLELICQFKRGKAFRHQIVSIANGGKPLWWVINARPKAEGGWRGVISDITAQRQAEQKASYMAHYDGLTDLPNRHQFNERLYHEIHRGSAKLAMMYLDLDNFKSINDTLGHPIGDKLLREVARRLEKCVSPDEIVARLGGDEFAVIVPAHRLSQTEQIADGIVSQLAEPFYLGDHDVVIGTSIGIAFAPEDASDPDILVRKADLALYSAKLSGRNRSMRFTPDMDKSAQDRRILEMDLRGALAKGEFTLYYQPLINLTDRKPSGYEALIRWDHPKRGIVMPGEFIKIAEETGMILQIGEWVIRTAVADLAEWNEELSVSINLSPIQMRSPSLVSTLANAIAAHGVNPDRICMEITETVLMHDSEANVATLHTLRRLGVQIALDDFGTGYSSLNYLRSFPFSKIKIDRCFITDIDVREDCRAIVKSVVDLARSLGMSTTAEGVESHAQLNALLDQGCNEVQGYLFGTAKSLDGYSDLRLPNKTKAISFEDNTIQPDKRQAA